MREILYRGQKQSTKEWVYGYLVTDGNAIIIIEKSKNVRISHTYCGDESAGSGYHWTIDTPAFRVIEETAGELVWSWNNQYNQYKLFEDDIVVLEDEEPYSNYHFSTDYDWSLTGVVKMIDGSWGVVTNDGCTILLHEIINSDICWTVIGNVHDNHELLEDIK